MLRRWKKVSETTPRASAEDPVEESSQLRRHLRRTLSVRFRELQARMRLGSVGQHLYLDSGVQLLRYPRNIFLGDHVVIKRNAELCACNASATIRIGPRTTVGHYTFIYASEEIHIGADCLIAPFVYLVDSDHGTRRTLPINRQGNQTAPVRIGNDVWLGTGARILKGVTIGDGAVVAAGALVKEDVPPYAIVGGIPARILGERE